MDAGLITPAGASSYTIGLRNGRNAPVFAVPPIDTPSPMAHRCRRANARASPNRIRRHMLNNLLTSVFGSRNERLLKQLSAIVKKINALEPQMQALSDDALKAKTEEYKGRIAKGESLDKLLPEAFAVCREASIRVFGMRHFDVQLIGGMVLHSGKIAEMRTGEGKTLTATLAVYLNALEGKGVHVVTVNDYLVKRDGLWMGAIYQKLGLSVAIIQSNGGNPNIPDAFLLDPDYVDEANPANRYLRPITRREA